MNSVSTLASERSASVYNLPIVHTPESPNQPLDTFDGGSQAQSRAHKTQEMFQLLVQFFILRSGHLRPVFLLTLLAEKGPLKVCESVVQQTELLEALMANHVDGVETLGGGNSGLEDQRLRMSSLLRLEVEGIGGVCCDLRQLRS